MRRDRRTSAAAAPLAARVPATPVRRPRTRILLTTEGTYRVTPADGKPDGVTRYTALHFREGDRWLTATVREAYPDVPAADKLTDLEWLIGDWEAKRDDRVVRTSYAWGTRRRSSCASSG